MSNEKDEDDTKRKTILLFEAKTTFACMMVVERFVRLSTF